MGRSFVVEVGMRGPLSRVGARCVALLLLACVGVTCLAYDSSVTVEARWRVLPYQSLTLIGGGSDPSLVSVAVPTPTERDRARGYVESQGAVRVHVASNIAWKLQLRLAEPVAGLEARRAGTEYVGLSTSPVVLAAGTYGSYDIDLDVRRLLRDDAGGESTPIQLIATIMPE